MATLWYTQIEDVAHECMFGEAAMVPWFGLILSITMTLPVTFALTCQPGRNSSETQSLLNSGECVDFGSCVPTSCRQLTIRVPVNAPVE